MKLSVLILVSIVLVLGPTLFADKNKCDGGHGGDKKCTDQVCKCAGNDNAMRREGEPDNPKNKQYPRYVCLQACTKTCCACDQSKSPKGAAKIGHNAAGHVTRAGQKPSCAACLLSRKALTSNERFGNKKP